MSEQNLHRNHGLFSDYFLNELLPKRMPEWQDHSRIEKAFNAIKSLYESLKSSLPQQSESQLEEKFIKKILTILGHVYEVQPTLVGAASGLKKPDYALFPDQKTQSEVQSLKGKIEFFKKVLAIAEAKKWERPLDREVKQLEDKDNPSLQMDRYLYYTEVTWGILTNGRYWRLYNRKTSKELDNYFEIDLQEILETGNLEAFKYFYFFFRREAFPEFIDQVYQGSIDYAKELGDNLKENVYEALKILARGFLKTPRNNLDPEKDLKEIHDNCLILLYRIIFLLYAESPRRGERLLPLDNPVYSQSYSLYTLKHKVRDLLTNQADLSPIKTTLWAELKALFALVNQGSESMGIPKNQFFVPAYNGGLFDEQEHQFLEKYSIADLYLAQAIDLLARTPVKGSQEKAFADYGSLQIRHLGSIYEGLLEYRLGIAQEKMVAISEKGKQKWVSAKEASGKKTIEEVEAGDVYLYTDKGERKATGSYYTPDYIVDYIVQNTLGPIIEELKKKVNGDNTKLIDEILNLKVLDPAMGSGHFLVAATDYLARALVEALGGSEKELEEDDIRWARREIIERCIFGVDLNPLAVELAKLSLWLSTVAKDKPLSFLDHHLRCGNSLIGAQIKDLAELPELKKKDGKKSKRKASQQLTLFEVLFKQVIQALLKDFEQIEILPSETVEQIQRKEELYKDFRKRIERFKVVADIWTSIYFGNEVAWTDYNALQEALNKDEEWKELSNKEWFKKGVQVAEEKRFFHWELEFPEVFFGERQKNPGFDVVVGNPPYVSAWVMFGIDSDMRSTIAALASEEDILGAHWDLYVAFLLKAYQVTRENGRFSFIIPNPFCREKYATEVRKFLLENTYIERIVSFGEENVFDEVSRQTLVPVFSKKSPDWDAAKTRIDDPLSVQQTTVSAKQRHREIPQVVFYKLPGYQIRHEVDPAEFILLDKIDRLSIRLGNLCYVNYGAQVSSKEKGGFGKDSLVSSAQLGNSKRFFEGKDLSRYNVEWSGLHLNYQPEIMYGPRAPELFESPKIVIRKISGENDSLVVAYDDQRLYCDDGLVLAVHYGAVENSMLREEFKGYKRLNDPYDLKYVLAIVASRLESFYYALRFATGSLQGTYSHVYPQAVRSLPLRRIFFTTPERVREELVSELKAYYAKGSFDKVLSAVESCLPKDKDGNFLASKEGATGTEEKSDVVHDLLAYLAEQMIAMNKEKNQEIKGFLGWLESYLGVKIDDLKNKTKIREYHNGSLNELFKALEQNHKAITKVDVTGREAREKIQAEFEKSMAKLKPLKDKIEATDRLIDQIVYRLYGLTDEEIKIVENSLKQNIAPEGEVQNETKNLF